MGARLADEVVDYLESNTTGSMTSPLCKLSFVGHSIGILVIRAALRQQCLTPYLPKLYLFVSLSGPQLGLMFGGNRVVKGGLRLMRMLGQGKSAIIPRWLRTSSCYSTHQATCLLACTVPLSKFVPNIAACQVHDNCFITMHVTVLLLTMGVSLLSSQLAVSKS